MKAAVVQSPPFHPPTGLRRRHWLALGAAAGLGAAWSAAQAQSIRRAPVLVLNSLDGTVSVIDGNSWVELRRIATGRTPSHLWIDSRSTTVYSSMQDSDELVAIDLATQTLVHRVKTGSRPADVFGPPGDNTLLVGLTGGTGVQVFEVALGQAPRAVGQIDTGKGAHAFRALGDRRHVLVSNRVANTISQIDYTRGAVVAEFPAPAGPDCMDVSADGTLIMVGSRWAGKLTLIDIAQRRVVNQVKVGRSPHGVWTLDHAGRI